jgi:hypothetical protein
MIGARMLMARERLLSPLGCLGSLATGAEDEALNQDGLSR